MEKSARYGHIKVSLLVLGVACVGGAVPASAKQLPVRADSGEGSLVSLQMTEKLMRTTSHLDHKKDALFLSDRAYVERLMRQIEEMDAELAKLPAEEESFFKSFKEVEQALGMEAKAVIAGLEELDEESSALQKKVEDAQKNGGITRELQDEIDADLIKMQLDRASLVYRVRMVKVQMEHLKETRGQMANNHTARGKLHESRRFELLEKLRKVLERNGVKVVEADQAQEQEQNPETPSGEKGDQE